MMTLAAALRCEVQSTLWIGSPPLPFPMRVTLQRALSLLRDGQVCAIPTETVYGLSARIDRPEGIEQIYSRKKRPRANPLIVHLGDAQQLTPFLASEFGHKAMLENLGRHFWPGPLALVLPVKAGSLHPLICAGLPTACFRVPDHPLTCALLRKSGPLVAPSANLSGRPSATHPDHVEADFGNDFPILDGGHCARGIESTILGWKEQRLYQLRAGALTLEQIHRALKLVPLAVDASEQVVCPGCHFPHYAPKARLHARIEQASDPRVVVGFSDRTYPNCARLFSLGTSDDDEGAAKRLFGVLRELDLCQISAAFVDLNLPDGGLWPAILERLERAARGN